MKMGKIEVTKKPQTLEFGKKTKISQKGTTPILSHR
tara:strand:- start:3624 stop:3731 length:108 start_codon:yes stop_codon:yes gene_type:complete